MRYEISTSLDKTQRAESPLSEPHFDDEATLLSARRVVPFHNLTDKTNSKRNLFFATALAAALMVGIVGGVIYARLERTRASRAQTTEVADQSLPQDDSVSSSEENVELAGVPEESQESQAVAVAETNQKTIDKPRNSSNIAKKSVALHPTPAKRPQTEPDESDYGWSERAIRRAERRAARRARREAAREPQRSDDLFRIREIFEGASRP